MKNLILVFIFLISSCASKRINEKPDFSLTGEAAVKEYKRFQLSYVEMYDGRFNDEGAFTNADGDKLRPLMEEVSPKSVKMMDAKLTKEKIYWVIFGAWLATAFIRDEHGRVSPLYWAGFAGTLGYGFYLSNVRNDVVDQFNKDLKMKFSPSLGYHFSF